ncbi:predicted protein [Chaetoceros tenuissimus]|uniref:Uncharacterized protein n=1 Tax=Chaetoceros tenuissimus TaxID=426638 RepID=A0AAD3CJK7_9STRA|nr:predicted protein [Chaetoceros tenuissimus]
MESDQPKRESKLSLSKRLKRQRRELEQPSGDSRFPIDEQQQEWDNSIFPPISEDSVVWNESTILLSNNDSSNIEQHSDCNCSMNEQHSSINEEAAHSDELPISKDTSSSINAESDSTSSVIETDSNSDSSKEEKHSFIEDSSIDDGHSDSESSIDESNVPKATNPFLLKIIAELGAKRLINFTVDNNDVLGIISDDATATNSKEKFSAHILGTSDFFRDRHSLKDIFHELLRFANVICVIMEDHHIDIRAFDTDVTFQKNVLSLMARYLERFAAFLPNKRLNMHLDEYPDRYADHTLLPLFFGELEFDKEDILNHAMGIFAAYWEGDGSTTHDPLYDTSWEDAMGNEGKRGTPNYDKKEREADMNTETIPYLEGNKEIVHNGKSPIVEITCSCAVGTRSSSFGASMMHVNRALGFKDGTLIGWGTKNEDLDVVGYKKHGNKLRMFLNSADGHGSKAEASKLVLVKMIVDRSIFKRPQAKNLLSFPSALYTPNRTVSGGHRKVPELSWEEKLKKEGVRRDLLRKDKILKEEHKQVCSNGLEDPNALAVYNLHFGEMAKLPRIKALPQDSLLSSPLMLHSSGMAQADGYITHKEVAITQHNHCYNAAWTKNVGELLGKVRCTERESIMSTGKGRMNYLLTVGPHFSHRREQVLVAICYYLFFKDIGLDIDFDVDFLSAKITSVWESLGEAGKLKHRQNVASWVEGQKRTRNYEEGAGLVDANEIESLLEVLEKTLTLFLSALKRKDPS